MQHVPRLSHDTACGAAQGTASACIAVMHDMQRRGQGLRTRMEVCSHVGGKKGERRRNMQPCRKKKGERRRTAMLYIYFSFVCVCLWLRLWGELVRKYAAMLYILPATATISVSYVVPLHPIYMLRCFKIRTAVCRHEFIPTLWCRKLPATGAMLPFTSTECKLFVMVSCV